MNTIKSIFLSIYFEFQSTLQTVREVLIGCSFDLSSKFYVLFKTGTSWQVTTSSLLSYPNNTLGFHLGCFLLQHKFEPQPRCEDHDIFHLLTGYSIDTSSEIAMQFWLWGNGKRSFFVVLAMLAGLAFYPDKYGCFKKAFRQGEQSSPIHHIDYKQYLYSPISRFTSIIH